MILAVLLVLVKLRKEEFIAVALKRKEGNKYNSKYLIVIRNLESISFENLSQNSSNKLKIFTKGTSLNHIIIAFGYLCNL